MIYIILAYGALNLLSRMGLMNYFSQVVEEILQNNYVKVTSATKW